MKFIHSIRHTITRENPFPPELTVGAFIWTPHQTYIIKNAVAVIRKTYASSADRISYYTVFGDSETTGLHGYTMYIENTSAVEGIWLAQDFRDWNSLGLGRVMGDVWTFNDSPTLRLADMSDEATRNDAAYAYTYDTIERLWTRQHYYKHYVRKHNEMSSL